MITVVCPTCGGAALVVDGKIVRHPLVSTFEVSTGDGRVVDRSVYCDGCPPAQAISAAVASAL